MSDLFQTTQPYGTAAVDYFDAGWHPLPVGTRPNQKQEPPKGYTGRDARDPSRADVQKWLEDLPRVNIATRAPVDVVGIDVDHYDAKTGGVTLARLETVHGPLPATWKSSARDGVSGIYWFHIRGDQAAMRNPGPYIDIVRSGHRYGMFPPSTNPDAGGAPYLWYRPDGEVAEPDEIPAVADLPYLPDEWEDHLTKSCLCYDRKPKELTVKTGDPVQRIYDEWAAGMANGQRHDTTVEKVYALVGAMKGDWPGAAEKLDAMRVQFVERIGDRAGPHDAEAEWERLYEGAWEKADAWEQWQEARNDSAVEAVEAVEVVDPFDHAVALEVTKIQVREAARRHVARQRLPDHAKAKGVRLDQLVATEWPDAKYRIDGWQLTDGRNMIVAQYKAGKTTLVGNLVRSLVDGEKWLGVADVEPVDGRVVVFDFEMSQRQLAEWYTDLGVDNANKVVVFAMRGKAGQFDILDADTRAQWAERIRRAEGAYVVLDPLGPAVKALGLSEDKDLGMYLAHFDSLLTEADVKEATVVHHMGHSLERGRGDSAQRGWPDAEIRVVRDGDEPNAPRFITAYGRDVDRPEGRLTFDPQTRRLTLSGGSRADEQLKIVAAQVYAYLDGLDPDSEDGRSGRAVEEHFKGDISRVHVRDALKYGIHLGEVTVKPGARNATLHYR